MVKNQHYHTSAPFILIVVLIKVAVVMLIINNKGTPRNERSFLFSTSISGNEYCLFKGTCIFGIK